MAAPAPPRRPLRRRHRSSCKPWLSALLCLLLSDGGRRTQMGRFPENASVFISDHLKEPTVILASQSAEDRERSLSRLVPGVLSAKFCFARGRQGWRWGDRLADAHRNMLGYLRPKVSNPCFLHQNDMLLTLYLHCSLWYGNSTWSCRIYLDVRLIQNINGISFKKNFSHYFKIEIHLMLINPHQLDGTMN